MRPCLLLVVGLATVVAPVSVVAQRTTAALVLAEGMVYLNGPTRRCEFGANGPARHGGGAHDPRPRSDRAQAGRLALS